MYRALPLLLSPFVDGLLSSFIASSSFSSTLDGAYGCHKLQSTPQETRLSFQLDELELKRFAYLNQIRSMN